MNFRNTLDEECDMEVTFQMTLKPGESTADLIRDAIKRGCLTSTSAVSLESQVQAVFSVLGITEETVQ